MKEWRLWSIARERGQMGMIPPPPPQPRRTRRWLGEEVVLTPPLGGGPVNQRQGGWAPPYTVRGMACFVHLRGSKSPPTPSPGGGGWEMRRHQIHRRQVNAGRQSVDTAGGGARSSREADALGQHGQPEVQRAGRVPTAEGRGRQ